MNNNNQHIIDIKDIKKIIRLLLSNWYIIVACLILSVGIYYYFINNKQEAAIARAGIALIDKGQDYNGYAENEFVAINSNDIISKTIDDLKLNVSYYKKSENKVQEIADSIPFRINIGIIDQSLHEKEITIQLLDSSTYRLSYVAGEENINKVAKFDSIITTAHIRLEILKNFNSYSNSLTNNEYILKIHDKNSLIAKYQNELDVNLADDINELKVTYKHALPKKALNFLDALSKNYIQHNLLLQIEKNNKFIGSINKMLNQTEVVLKNLQDSLAMYTAAEGGYENAKSMHLSNNLRMEKREMQSYLTYIKDVKKYLIENKDMGVPPPLYLDENTDVFLKSALQEIYELQLKLKDVLSTATKKSILTSSIDDKYENRKSDLLKYLTNTQTTIEERIALLEKEINSDYIKQNMAYIGQLNHKLKINEAMYSQLLEKRNNIMLASESMDPAYKIFESPHIINPPSNLKTLLAFLLSSLLLAFLIIFIKTIFWSKIESIDELKEKASNIPVIGELSLVESIKQQKNNAIIHIENNHLAFSLLRGLRTNIDFILSSKNSKKILITSHSPSEGKTFLAVNVASIFAKSNKRVLLIDMDLHKPNIHKSIETLNENNQGVTHILKGDSSIKNAIQNTTLPNMDVIYAGEADKMGSELILSDTTEKIIQYGEKHYDYIIIDTPPIGLISDALTLMKFSDINLFVINSEKAYKESIKQANEILLHNKFKIYFVLNKVKNRNIQYYSKYYQYAYAS